ncbi:MAG: glycine cleavage system aminomethyltransferase GcvT [Planctomycetes bacterium]|nr:glycine cleavage system aminomethyltransferase GcvT [Planctomycetota bacterium]
MLKTPLAAIHEGSGAKMVEFGGWWMPVLYTSITQEHTAVRTGVGLFDTSHMGRLIVRGGDDRSFLERMVTNEVASLQNGRARYSLVTREDGGVIDDILIYADSDHYFIVVNASNCETVLSWFRDHIKPDDVTIEDVTERLAMIAVQGPAAAALVKPMITGCDASALPYYGFAHGSWKGAAVVISRTGYTGEDGFELFIDPAHAAPLWQALTAGGAKPCGLGARDTLRLEAGMPLYGHEIDLEHNPIEAGLGSFVKLEKGFFVGRDALARIRQAGPARRCVGLEVNARRIPRAGHAVWSGGAPVGAVVSGTASPTLAKNIATAYVPAELATVGTALEVEISDQRHPAVVVKKPFYRRG